MMNSHVWAVVLLCMDKKKLESGDGGVRFQLERMNCLDVVWKYHCKGTLLYHCTVSHVANIRRAGRGMGVVQCVKTPV